MKLLLSIFSSIIILLSGSRNLLILADYQLNRTYYEQLCENKGKPAMQCHGKCQMTKESKEKSKDLNFERFSFDFYQTPTEIFPDEVINLSVETSIDRNFIHFSLPKIELGVPNPPPNFS